MYNMSMNVELKSFLAGLQAYGVEKNIPNISDEVALFLNTLIRVKRPESILEIGCANGYSTIWMAEAAKEAGAHIDTIDHSKPTFEQARQNIEERGFGETVTLHFGDALKVIPALPKEARFDFVFVDGEKASYLDFFRVVEPRLQPKAVLVFDDMLAFPEKTRAFSEALKDLKGFQQIILPIEKDDGILLMLKNEYEV